MLRIKELQNLGGSIQGPDSILKYHKHPNSIISGIIYLKVDDDSSKLVFQNPTSMTGEVKEITPTNGLMLMWSFLMHGSGATINKSKERIILAFNSFDKKCKNNAKKQKVRFHKVDRKPKSTKNTILYLIKLR